MDGRETQLQAGLSRFLAAEWLPGARVSDLARIPGGASRETWRLKAHAGEASRGMIVRIDPETSLIDTDRRTEYRAMEAAFLAGIPGPSPLFLEAAQRWLRPA